MPSLLILTVLLIGCGAGSTAATVGATLATAAATASSPAAPAATATAIPTVVAIPTPAAPAPIAPAQPATPASRPAAASAATPGTPAGRGTPATTVEVRIRNFAFEPAIVTVPVGTTVVWRNTEGFHTVLSADFMLQSEPLEVGATYSFTFTKPGSFAYECGIHPEMQAVIQVVP